MELKEESEKAKLSPVKEKRSYKRFDLFVALAVLGILLVMLFQSVFIFELYRFDLSVIDSYLPASWRYSAPAEEAAPQQAEVQNEEPPPEESAEPVSTDDEEEPAAAVDDEPVLEKTEEPVPVG